ncbi:hydroxymethylglutaryl-CoA reductase [Natronomonas gomsonensis]|jgi:hydroxymethylglutaryl-CoA reductase (NADPH)|uniref:hydroxymethylglutaryl-CoA reductase n=1 Tax=Natronomonas gomsonensis TaxID=1046043 RepID=UPI0020CA5C4E|nr:hydroxymethylglutaryl-CoA reductase [Natronomonas gomsonensis]MCY4732645.1 hydroxymethylglutaryl-CoA reductase [Natronomonas gomsonensis]
MVIPTPDSGILKRIYANIVGSGGFVSLDIPEKILKRLYTYGSLKDTDRGVEFEVKNRLQDAKFAGINRLVINGDEVDPERVRLETADGDSFRLDEVTKESPIQFPVGRTVTVVVEEMNLPTGDHDIHVDFVAEPFGELTLEIGDTIRGEDAIPGIPRSDDDNYSEEAIAERHEYLEEKTGTELEHVPEFSFDAARGEGNIENFIGVAQMPLGLAGPVKINGEHADGEYPIPMATTEGTLVASYSRGMKAINLSGGAKTTVVDDRMNRAPVFVFEDARNARDFRDWVFEHYDTIKEKAEETSSVAELVEVEDYMTNNFAHLRFSYRTGDAAGQNMVGKATFAACNWVLQEYPGYVENFYLEGNFATDKKASKVNDMMTRGKRVTAEVTLDRDTCIHHLGAEPDSLAHHSKIATLGSFFSGANTNGAHPANGLAALFIATGQDEANVAESSAAILNTTLLDDDSLHISVTIPSLIVATYGGGTGMATQQECLEILDCSGPGNVNKLAEIAAATVLAGEISLGAAISASDWVTSHESLGRNR